MAKSTKSERPRKPHPDFPLFAHQVGQWAKKLKGKTLYFGVWADPQAALQKWLAEKDDLIAGRVPRFKEGVAHAPTLRDLCNTFLTAKAGRRDNGELSPRNWSDYHHVCNTLIETFGRDRQLADILPDDFERLRAAWSAKWGPVRLSNHITYARVVFNFAYKNRMIPAPIWFGEGFRRPSKKTLRAAREAQGPKMFAAEEVRRLLDMANARRFDSAMVNPRQ